MNTLILTLVTFGGFYSIYKAIKSLDKIYHINKYGIKASAKVTNIREEKNTDSDGDTTYTYYYFVTFIDNRGKTIEKEIEFPVTKKPKRNPPFSKNILYSSDDNNNLSIILEKNEGRNTRFILSLIIGIGMLAYVTLNYNGEFDIIINYIENYF